MLIKTERLTIRMAEGAPKRHVAYKLSIGEVLSGSFIKGDGWDPNYLLIKGGKAYRINFIGILVAQEQEADGWAARIEDGTGSITLRRYQETEFIDELQPGDAVQAIARPRLNDTEVYLIAETIRKIDQHWMKLRKEELKEALHVRLPGSGKTQKIEAQAESKPKELNERIYELIRTLDRGEGADIDEVCGKSADPNTEQIIQGLLKVGDLFEIRPGKVKILE